MATIVFPAPIVTINSDADGTIRIESSAPVVLTPAEATELASFITAAQPVTAAPAVDVPAPATEADPLADPIA